MSPQQLLGQIVLNVVPGPDGAPEVQVNCSLNLTHHAAIQFLLTGAKALADQLVVPVVPKVETATAEQVPPAPVFNGANRIKGKV